MISNKEKNKLKNGILFGLYRIYHQSNSLYINSDVLISLINHKCDEHDIVIALRSLKADSFINVEFFQNDIWSDTITLTQKGIDYCYEHSENQFIKYIKQNHLAIIAIIISIIALFNQN